MNQLQLDTDMLSRMSTFYANLNLLASSIFNPLERAVSESYLPSEYHNLHLFYHFGCFAMSRAMNWARHVKRTGKIRSTYVLLTGKHITPLERPNHRCKNNIEIVSCEVI